MALDLTSEQLDMLRGTVYGGYRTVPVWRDQDDPGPRSEIDFDFYGGTRFEPDDAETNLWAAVAQEVGIKNINSQNDIRQLYDYVLGYSGGGSNTGASDGGNNTNPTPLDIDPKRGTGEYDDIIDALKDELSTAQTTIQDLGDRQVSTIETQQIDFQNALNELNLGFEERYGAMQSMMEQQQREYQQQVTTLQQQAQAAQAAYQQQLLIAQNLSRASVPEAQASAATAAVGDLREGTSIARKTKDNALSSLSILSGLGTSSSPLAGLQLA